MLIEADPIVSLPEGAGGIVVVAVVGARPGTLCPKA